MVSIWMWQYEINNKWNKSIIKLEMRDILLRSREKVGFRKRKSQLFDELNFWSFHSPTRGPAVRVAICFSALATHILMSLQLVMLKKRGGADSSNGDEKKAPSFKQPRPGTELVVLSVPSKRPLARHARSSWRYFLACTSLGFALPVQFYNTMMKFRKFIETLGLIGTDKATHSRANMIFRT